MKKGKEGESGERTGIGVRQGGTHTHAHKDKHAHICHIQYMSFEFNCRTSDNVEMILEVRVCGGGEGEVLCVIREYFIFILITPQNLNYPNN